MSPFPCPLVPRSLAAASRRVFSFARRGRLLLILSAARVHVFVPSFAQGAARFVCGEAACFARFRSLVAAGCRVYFVCGEDACFRSRLRAASLLRGGRWLPRSCGWAVGVE